MWKEQAELVKQRERLLRLQVRVQSELSTVNSALRAVHSPGPTPCQWTEALESTAEALELHSLQGNWTRESSQMMSRGFTPYYCCGRKYTGRRLVYGRKAA